MSKTSILMLPSSQNQLNLVGGSIRADGWYGYTDGLHTVSIYLMNFQGRIYFEASLATTPTDNDWFPIIINRQMYFSFPANPLMPTGTTGDTGCLGFNIVGNFTWLRARVDRSYLSPVPTAQSDIDALGYVDRILLNH